MTVLEMILSAFLFIFYLTAIFTVAGLTFSKGHWILGVLGIFFPILWLIGAILPPTEAAVLEG
jgi:hypothetical protein